MRCSTCSRYSPPVCSRLYFTGGAPPSSCSGGRPHSACWRSAPFRDTARRSGQCSGRSGPGKARMSPVLPPTPWYLSPLFVAFAVFAAAVVLTVKDVVRKKVSRWFDFIWFLIAGLAGCLVFFLVFVSEHEATSPNYLAFWLNPFCLVVPSLVFIKTLRKWLYFYHFI